MQAGEHCTRINVCASVYMYAVQNKRAIFKTKTNPVSCPTGATMDQHNEPSSDSRFYCLSTPQAATVVPGPHMAEGSRFAQHQKKTPTRNDNSPKRTWRHGFLPEMSDQLGRKSAARKNREICIERPALQPLCVDSRYIDWTNESYSTPGTKMVYPEPCGIVPY